MSAAAKKKYTYTDKGMTISDESFHEGTSPTLLKMSH